MSERGRDDVSPSGAIELLSPARFLEALRHVTRFRASPIVGDPLESAVKRIERNPAYTQSRLLARVLTALAYQQGEFRRAELAAFDSETLAVVLALMDAETAGTTSREEWKCAVDLASAAQRDAGG